MTFIGRKPTVPAAAAPAPAPSSRWDWRPTGCGMRIRRTCMRIRLTIMRIRLTLMRIRIRVFTLVRIHVRRLFFYIGRWPDMNIYRHVFILLNLKRKIISIIKNFLGTVLWNRSCFLRFRIRLSTSYGSGSRKEIKCTNLYCVCENFCDSILLRFLFRNRN